MSAFLDFLDEVPGLSSHAHMMYDLIERKAERAGKQIAEKYTPASLRTSVYDDDLSPSLISQRRIMADALELDPSGQLAALPSLRAWASRPEGIGNTWVNWWVIYRRAYLETFRTTMAEAAE